jgi:Icc protein
MLIAELSKLGIASSSSSRPDLRGAPARAVRGTPGKEETSCCRRSVDSLYVEGDPSWTPFARARSGAEVQRRVLRMQPLYLVQLSDLHIGADWGGVDPSARVVAVVASVRALVPEPDAVLVTGDLAEHGLDEEYEQVRHALAPLGAPVHVLPGNHDDRTALRRHFDLPGTDGDPIHYAADAGPVRLLALDSTIPGEDRGALGAEQLTWLDAALASDPKRPTVIAMHHAPIPTGVPAFDEMGLAPADRAALAELLGRHAQVQRIVSGHLHRAITGAPGGRAALVVPSAYVQIELDFDRPGFAVANCPPGFAVHVLLDGQLVSHVEYAER